MFGRTLQYLVVILTRSHETRSGKYPIRIFDVPRPSNAEYQRQSVLFRH